MSVDKQAVFDYIDNHKDQIIEYVQKMVSIPSINHTMGGNEKNVQDWLANSLREFEFDKVDQFAVDEEEVRPNVVAVMRGSGEGKSIIFNGHMDVVPIARPEVWHNDPFDPVIKDGKMFGRGTSDMKGPIGSVIWAMKALKECKVELKGDVLLQAVVGEESNQAEEVGTVPCLERGYTADFAVVCEPTNLELHTSSVGLFMFELIVEGKAVHTSARNQVIFPQPGGVPSGGEVGVDAFKKSLPIINYLYSLEEQWNHRWRDPVLGTGGKPIQDSQGISLFTINPSLIEGGDYLGAVPSRVKYTYNVWFPDQLVSKEEVWEELRKGVEAISSTDDYLRENPPTLNIPVFQDWAGFKVPVEHPGVQTMIGSIEEASGEQAILSGFKAVCDATYLNKHGVPAVVFGPGSLSWSVHGDNEYITVDSIIEAAKVYASMMIDWCND
ncbi:ArgE/DapE family deacylase [Virgibacillus sp. W0430]|uniref:ArgE/DapE family deacylase n=1 Tax=Virgibacillus sp. W0430 TaxID=3391580 RepID=UPI003F4811C4